MPAIKDAIGQLPSWPGLVIGAVVIFGIGGWYYGTSYVQCAELNEGRQALRTAIGKAADSASGVLELASVMPGDWDEARIVQAHRPGQVPLNCPFGWDLTWRERQALIEADQYTIIGFFAGGQFQSYIEYCGDWAAFIDPPASITRAAARFTVIQPATSGQPYTLKLDR